MGNFVEVNKVLGESVVNTSHLQCREMRLRPRDWNYQSVRKMFCDNLKAKGYDKIINDGSYIIASNDNEKVTFYFAAHSPQNKNYCVSTVLKYKVDYFAFYNNKTDVVYTVGYGIVRKYCKSLKDAYTFYDYRKPKLFIPDSWALQQKINTMLLY